MERPQVRPLDVHLEKVQPVQPPLPHQRVERAERRPVDSTGVLGADRLVALDHPVVVHREYELVLPIPEAAVHELEPEPVDEVAARAARRVQPDRVDEDVPAGGAVRGDEVRHVPPGPDASVDDHVPGADPADLDVLLVVEHPRQVRGEQFLRGAVQYKVVRLPACLIGEPRRHVLDRCGVRPDLIAVRGKVARRVPDRPRPLEPVGRAVPE